MRHDLSRDNDIPDIGAKNIQTVLNVAHLKYHFEDKSGLMHDRDLYILANSENDCLKTISENLPPKCKWGVDTFETIVCCVSSMSKIIKRLLYDELRKEFEPKEVKETLADKIKKAAKRK